MKKKDRICLDKIAGYCGKIISFTDGLTREEFLENEMVIFSCSFALGQIGELIKQLSEEFLTENHQIPWRKIVGFRNMLVHEYEKIRTDILWEAIETGVPELLQYAQEILRGKD